MFLLPRLALPRYCRRLPPRRPGRRLTEGGTIVFMCGQDKLCGVGTGFRIYSMWTLQAAHGAGLVTEPA